jgi:alkyl sulfatase BDS1-like metallo-beta-lactamase superfamily hydrolase
MNIDSNAQHTLTLANGARAHREHVAQNDVIRTNFELVRPGVWSFVGNGLSNQTFVEGPQGIIAIDTGESIEEMRTALVELRRHTTRPIAAVLYSHFHYVEGTRAVLEEGNHLAPLPIYGHHKIADNRSRTSSEIAPAYARGLVEQFAMLMPDEGPDATVNIGLGLFYRNPAHAPFTKGHLPITDTLGDGATTSIAGLTVQSWHAPSDADDSVTLWFPELETAVQNLVWPTLFNVFAIRGEEYRDPLTLLRGIDQLAQLQPAYLVATHGPSLQGRESIAQKIERYRDSIQFMWDQTVRGVNKGLSTDQIAATVVLPEVYHQDYLTSERYGVTEHHVRQIHNGLRGWFDGDESKLFPVEPTERYGRLVRGFGGRAAVTQQVHDALAANDPRWATELATWLVRSDGATPDDRSLLASCLRVIGERTSAANIRNWCITRARHLDGSTPLDRLFTHRFTSQALRTMPTTQLFSTLRVLLDPTLVPTTNHHVAFVVDGEHVGLHVRNGVAVPTDGRGAADTVTLSRASVDALLQHKASLAALLATGDVVITGDRDAVLTTLAAFEIPGWRSE